MNHIYLKSIIVALFSMFFSLTAFSQKLTVESFAPAPMDLTASTSPVKDLNGKACGLVKVQLAVDGADFEGNVIKPVKHTGSQYLVYMTEGSYKLNVNCAGYLPLSVNFRDYGVQNVASKQTYVLTVAMPSGAPVNTDDGMRYLIIKASPANATIVIDGNLQNVQNGSVSILLSRGAHTYSVAAPGFSTKSGTVEIGDSKKTIEVALESALAQLSVSCPTPGAQIYVNEQLKGSSPWSGQLSAGNYQIEARHDGYRSQKQSVTLQERENKSISLPALSAITGALNVNYQPTDAEVWLDGKKIGTSPDVFRNILIGNHALEVRSIGYKTEKKDITISEGETLQLTGSLGSAAKVPVPEAVDLGLSVKWASFNLGASKPEEYGYYYKCGETISADDKGDETYKFGNGIYDDMRILRSKYDAATVNLNDDWRMPTDVEIKELISKCKRVWTTRNGVNGIRVTGPNGNSIFIPASGYRDNKNGTLYNVGSYGYLWSSTPYGAEQSYSAYFYSGSWHLDYFNRACAFSIRPVQAK